MSAASIVGSSGLGFGVAFVLEDYFSRTADTVQAKMNTLSANTEIMANKVNSALKRMKVGGAMLLAGGLLLAPFAKGIDLASDYEENMNKLDVAFGKYADNVRAFTDTTLKKFGIDKIESSNMAALFGDMATGMGLSQKKAAEMSKTLVGLAGDLASFKNISHSQASTALKGIFTGETESLKNLGIVATQANIKAWMAAKGINKAFDKMSQSEKVLIRMQYVMEQAKNSIGDFERTGDSYANVSRKMDGAAKELSMTLGDVLKPVVTKVKVVITKLMDGLIALSKSPVGKFILRLTAVLGGLLFFMGLWLLLTGGIKFMLLKAVFALGASTKAKIIETIATKGLTVATWQLATATFSALLPYILIAAAIGAVIYVMYKLWTAITEGTEKARKIATVFLALFGWIGLIIGVVAYLKKGFTEFNKDADKMTKTGLVGFFTKVAGVIKAVWQIWKSWNGSTFEMTDKMREKLEALGIWNIVKAIGKVVIVIKDIAVVIWEVIKAIGEMVWWLISGAFSLIGDAIVGVYDIFSWLFGGIWDLIGWIVSVWWDFITFLFHLPEKVFDVGVRFVTYIWDGIKTFFPKLVDWMQSAVARLVDMIVQPIKDAWGSVKSFVGLGDDETENPSDVKPDAMIPKVAAQYHHNYTSKNLAVAPVVNVPQPVVSTAPVTVTLQIDSDEVAHKVVEQQELKQARND